MRLVFRSQKNPESQENNSPSAFPPSVTSRYNDGPAPTQPRPKQRQNEKLPVLRMSLETPQKWGWYSAPKKFGKVRKTTAQAPSPPLQLAARAIAQRPKQRQNEKLPVLRISLETNSPKLPVLRISLESQENNIPSAFLPSVTSRQSDGPAPTQPRPKRKVACT